MKSIKKKRRIFKLMKFDLKSECCSIDHTRVTLTLIVAANHDATVPYCDKDYSDITIKQSKIGLLGQ